jgi:hypothetical protein
MKTGLTFRRRPRAGGCVFERAPAVAAMGDPASRPDSAGAACGVGGTVPLCSVSIGAGGRTAAARPCSRSNTCLKSSKDGRGAAFAGFLGPAGLVIGRVYPTESRFFMSETSICQYAEASVSLPTCHREGAELGARTPLRFATGRDRGSPYDRSRSLLSPARPLPAAQEAAPRRRRPRSPRPTRPLWVPGLPCSSRAT